MSNEITTQIITTLTNPTSSSTAALLTAAFNRGPYKLTQTTAAKFEDVVTVGTSEQDISLPTSSKFTAALQGIFCAVNLDSTNFVKLGPKSAGNMIEMVRLYPLTPVQISIAPSVVLRWIADSASCSVAFMWLAK